LGLARVDLAEVAAAGAGVAADEERRLAVLPALEDVGAGRLLADGVQPLATNEVLEGGVVRPGAQPGLDPRRLLLDRGRRVARLEAQQPASVRGDRGHATSVGRSTRTSSRSTTGNTSRTVTARPVSLVSDVTPASAMPQ